MPPVFAEGSVVGGRYRITRHLGQGAMGVLYEAQHTDLNTTAVLKVMLTNVAALPGAIDRFRQESRLAAQLGGENVVTVYDAGVDGATGAYWYAMELLRGENLEDYVRRVGPLTLHEMLDILSQVCKALEAAHEAAPPIVHRDLKPENIFRVAPRRGSFAFRIKVIDFGVAKIVGQAIPGLGQTNGLVGSPGWAAPEQARVEQVTPAADVWALGLIAFFLLTGHYFWRAAIVDPHVQVDQLQRQRQWLLETCVELVPPASQRLAELRRAGHVPARVSLPPAFDAWFARVTAQVALSRPPNARAAFFELAQLLKFQQVTPDIVPAPPARPAQPRAARIVGGFAAVLILATGAWQALPFFTTPPSPQPIGTTPLLPPPPTAPPSLPPAPPCSEGMVAVPAPADSTTATVGTQPHGTLTVRSFCLDRTEVTVSAFRECSASRTGATNCPVLPTTVQRTEYSPADAAFYNRFCNAGLKDRDDHPINCVDWNMASAFCHAVGKRLPSAAEWERGAHGDANRPYPWGDERPSAKLLNACGLECRRIMEDPTLPVLYAEDDQWPWTAPVGSFSGDLSAFQISDMGGNLIEWVDDPAGPGQHALRGGGWISSTTSSVHITDPKHYPADVRDVVVGFRCARDQLTQE